jgi:hypothetical protein
MKVLIQHNFKSGLGDLFIDMSEYMTMCKELKELGYEIHLRLCLYYNKYVKNPFLTKVLSQKTIDFFDSIEETYSGIHSMEFEDYKYGFSAHHPQSPGQHRWDVFFDVFPEIQLYNKRLSIHYLLTEKIDFITPKFSNLIEENAKKFANSMGDNYNFFHIRVYDDGESDEGIDLISSNVENVISQDNKMFHIGSNNAKLVNKLKNNPKVKTYEFTTLSVIDNDMNTVIHTEINDDEVFLTRVIDTLSEMVSIQYSDMIYHSGYYNWSSSFLFYGVLMSGKKEDKFKRINYK